MCVCVRYKTDSDRADWASQRWGGGRRGKQTLWGMPSYSLRHKHIHSVCSGCRWSRQRCANKHIHTHTLSLWAQTFWHGLFYNSLPSFKLKWKSKLTKKRCQKSLWEAKRLLNSVFVVFWCWSLGCRIHRLVIVVLKAKKIHKIDCFWQLYSRQVHVNIRASSDNLFYKST